MTSRRDLLRGAIVGIGAAGLVGARSGTPALAATGNIVDPYDFGARPDWAIDSTQAIRNAIAALPPEGGIVEFKTAGTYRIIDTILVQKRVGITIRGIRGNGIESNPNAGTRLKWGGPAGGTMLLFDQVTRSVVEAISLHGKEGRVAGLGMHWTNDPPVVIGTGLNEIRDVSIASCQVGIQTGRPGANQPNISEFAVYNLELSDCTDGVLFQSDQGGQWCFYSLAILSCGTGIRMGAGFPNRGNFAIFGASLGNNGRDIYLPSQSGSVLLMRLVSESREFLRVDEGAPELGHSITLMDCMHINAPAGSKSIRYRQSGDLRASSCWFNFPVEVGHASANPGLEPLRVFDGCRMAPPILLDTNRSYRVIRQNAPGFWTATTARVAYELSAPTGPLARINGDGSIWCKNVQSWG